MFNLRNFIIRLIINAAAIAITAWLLPGIHVNGAGGGSSAALVTLLLIALVFGIINAVIKPILLILTCPMVILTLGLFIFIINGLLLWITSLVLGNRFVIDSFWSAVLGGIVMGIAAIVVEWVLDRLGLDESK